MPRIKFTSNLKTILDDKTVDIVDIVTPIRTHFNLVIKFLKKNKDVLVEKPLIFNKRQKKVLTNLLDNKKNYKFLIHTFIRLLYNLLKNTSKKKNW